ncbi:Mn-containing catalase [Thermosporothrix hazakensis]|jgi:Mn-containing catalase|uniref:Mn-containing catalase n=2 Tax=Thermosporothrix TaxID=768650 RepID=A0A326U121_THEHA|nr:manganese catalase family protein [Thermosporothrix hazakensis]PZW23588.1 Mn-containing catalase [Thermosporothrix hazakensis]BBH86744.1 catalase [Thermosporothrix sp. COM3]GCE51046.1 catalase [Thermosporothrix hazakensis]
MFFSDPHLAYPVRVEKPNPVFAKMLQQAIGGIEGEMRVCLQYLFQAWGFRGPAKYRDMIYNTGTEEIGHIEMLATAVALNLEGAPTHMQEEAEAASPAVAAVLGGMNPRHYLSAGLAATAEDSQGNPFNGSWVVASGNLAADMYANVMAESTGRLLATRLWEMTDDPGMKDMLAFLIARDTMHQNQWLAVLEELDQPLPVPGDFPQGKEKQEFSYQFFVQSKVAPPADSRFAQGTSVDGKGQFQMVEAKPLGDVPQLAPAPNESHTTVMMKNPARIKK